MDMPHLRLEYRREVGMIVADCERPAQSETEQDYTPGKVRFWLINWAELQELAMPTAPAMQYPGPEVHGSTPADRTRYCDIMVDLERVAVRLPRWSVEAQVVEWSMKGRDLVTIAEKLGLSVGATNKAFGEATEAMARWLGWRG
jgi:hypothetical protein